MKILQAALESGNTHDNIVFEIIKLLPPFRRYENQTLLLRYLILNQLNLPKNSKKGPMEELDLYQLFYLLIDEVNELKQELDKKTLNIDRALSEIGDIGAFLVGMSSKILEQVEIKKLRKGDIK